MGAQPLVLPYDYKLGKKILKERKMKANHAKTLAGMVRRGLSLEAAIRLLGFNQSLVRILMTNI